MVIMASFSKLICGLKMNHVKLGKLPSFHKAEELAIAHRKLVICGLCTVRVAQSQLMSVEQQEELQMIRDGVKVNKEMK